MSSFFEWWQDPNTINKFKEILYENIRSFMELMHSSWDSIMLMPYKFFIDTLKWKIDLENEKIKQHKGDSVGGTSSQGFVKG